MYEQLRPRLYGTEERLSYDGRGVRDLLIDIVDSVQSEGLQFEDFTTVAETALDSVRREFDDRYRSHQ
jgi:hypothetical protein